MTKAEFLEKIKVRIIMLPYGELCRHIDYYDEMINDRMEEGLSEEEAVATMEPPELIAEQILREVSPLEERAEPIPAPQPIPAPKPKRSYGYRLGFLPFAILLLLVTIAMHLVAVCLAGCAVGFCILCVWAAVNKGLAAALIMGGTSLISLGTFFFLLQACSALRRATGRCMRWVCGKNSKEVPEQ